MNRYLLLILLLSSSLFFLNASEVLADVINPNFFTAKCEPGEVEVTCSWSRSSLSSPINKDGCAKYKNNPSYRYLEGTGSTFGGRAKYCFKAVSPSELLFFHVKSFLPLFAITLLIEVPVFFIFGLSSKKAITSLTIANLLSTLLFYFSTTFLPFSGILIIVAMEIAVIAFETFIIKNSLKEVGFRKIISSVLLANIASAIIGSFVLTFIT